MRHQKHAACQPFARKTDGVSRRQAQLTCSAAAFSAGEQLRKEGFALVEDMLAREIGNEPLREHVRGLLSSIRAGKRDIHI